MALIHTPVCVFGTPAPDFLLPGVDGRDWSLTNCRGPNGLLVMFICNHCPYVKSVQQKLVREARELAGLGIGSVAVMSNDPEDYPEDSFDNMVRVAREMAYPFPYLFDARQEVARLYGAVCTPDFFGYNRDLELQYRGRLDASGRDSSSEVHRRDLFEAMKTIATTSKGPIEQIPSMGCSIKWRQL